MSKKDLTEALAVKGRKSYSDLKWDEKRAIVALFIREQDYIDKSSLLVDADIETKLPNLVADVIESNGSVDTAISLIEELIAICTSHFAESIDEALEDEMREQPVPYIDDLRRQDAAERAADMRKAC